MLAISIHAPPARGDEQYATVSYVDEKFQFTPLREGRLNIVHTPFTRISFQFTPLREGRHFLRVGHNLPVIISIHAPPRGATFSGVCCCHTIQFQFTPLREGRLLPIFRHS